MSNFRLPLTAEQENPLVKAFVKEQKLNKLPRREYAAKSDHEYLYPAGEYVNHDDPTVQEACFRVLAEVKPHPTTKEVAFSLGIQTPIHVAQASKAWGRKIGSDAYKLHPNRAKSGTPREKAVLPSAVLPEIAAMKSKKDIIAYFESLRPQPVVEEVKEASDAA